LGRHGPQVRVVAVVWQLRPTLQLEPLAFEVLSVPQQGWPMPPQAAQIPPGCCAVQKVFGAEQT
jgi:hypothetical protein